MLVTKEFAFDAAHRLPNHKGMCKNIHGHLFRLQITLRGEIVIEKGKSNEGMVMDFGEIKRIAKQFIDAHLDHHYLSSSEDKEVNAFMEKQGFAITILDFIPTVENMVTWIHLQLFKKFRILGVELLEVKLWETPTSYATFTN